ncbi:hypothetical protein H4O14_02210 [Bacillus sp. PAMC26568]|nr:hypothetical protein H4O14_02210 [Bacillus sp. PAMC26568]
MTDKEVIKHLKKRNKRLATALSQATTERDVYKKELVKAGIEVPKGAFIDVQA